MPTADTHPTQQRAPSTSTTSDPEARPRHSARAACCPCSYDDTTRKRSRAAGPGRGNRCVPETVLEQAESVLKKPKVCEQELRQVLGRLTSEHRVLQEWWRKLEHERDRAYELLTEKYEIGDEVEAVRRANRRALAIELVGEGYSMSGSRRTFDRHRALAIGAIKQIAGQDHLKQ